MKVTELYYLIENLRYILLSEHILPIHDICAEANAAQFKDLGIKCPLVY